MKKIYFLILLILFSFGCERDLVDEGTINEVEETKIVLSDVERERSSSISDIIDEVMTSVVCIYVEREGKVGFEGGTGIILESNGHILTNRHVIESSQAVWIVLRDRSVYKAVSIFPDVLMDLAVVKIDADNLTPMMIGDSDELRIGDEVIVIGNSVGISPPDGVCSATTGIVSKKDCFFVMQGVPYYDIIQTSAAINTGDSGGPLINRKGEVIGINSSHALFAQNVGYAMSMNTAKRVFASLSAGRSSHPYLGISVDNEVMKMQTCVVTDVDSNSPAFYAGLRKGDVIMKVDDARIYAASDLLKSVWRKNVGDIINIIYERDGEIVFVSARLLEKNREGLIFI